MKASRAAYERHLAREKEMLRAKHNMSDIRRILNRSDEELLGVLPARRLNQMRRWAAGETLAEIGADEGVSRQNIHQQLHRWLKHLDQAFSS